MIETDAVPGNAPPNKDLFRIGQILAWLGNRPADWGARMERRNQIRTLLAPLARHAVPMPAGPSADAAVQ